MGMRSPYEAREGWGCFIPSAGAGFIVLIDNFELINFVFPDKIVQDDKERRAIIGGFLRDAENIAIIQTQNGGSDARDRLGFPIDSQVDTDLVGRFIASQQIAAGIVNIAAIRVDQVIHTLIIFTVTHDCGSTLKHGDADHLQDDSAGYHCAGDTNEKETDF